MVSKGDMIKMNGGSTLVAGGFKRNLETERSC